MKICAAQTKPVKGDIEYNIEHHIAMARLAAQNGARLIIFPELSLTGYEPSIAGELATSPDDERLKAVQEVCDHMDIVIGAGIPTAKLAGTCISMVIFRPRRVPLVYSKKYLHIDEAPFFVSGDNLCCITIDDTKIALSICYELSIQEHQLNAVRTGADIYIASVAKTKTNIDAALNDMSEIARKFRMTTLIANCTGICDGNQCAGKSSLFNNRGKLIGQLDENTEGLLMIDTSTGHKSVILAQERTAFAY